MYCDSCEQCGKQFKTRHYTWFVCLDCHRKITLEEYNTRIGHDEELE